MKKKKFKEKHVDDEFSLFIRERDEYRCQIKLPPTYSKNGEMQSRCYGFIPPPTNLIQCSHFFSRIHRGTRFDEDNCDAICARCHRIIEEEKNGIYWDWKLAQIGPSRFNELRERHHRENYVNRHNYEALINKFRAKREKLKEERDGIVFGRRS